MLKNSNGERHRMFGLAVEYCQTGKIASLVQLLTSLKDDPTFNINYCVTKSQPPLIMIVSQLGNVGAIEAILKFPNANPNLVYEYQSPLSLAISHNLVDAVKALVDAEANVYLPIDEDGHCALVASIMVPKLNEDFDTVFDKKVSHEIFKIMFKGNKVPLGSKGSVKVLQDVNWMTKHGKTLLYYCVLGENYEICEFLLENGADPHKQGHNSSSAMQLAESKGDLRMIKILSVDRERFEMPSQLLHTPHVTEQKALTSDKVTA